MKRWICDRDFRENAYVESAKIDLFLKEINAISKKYNFSISHEDYQGAFIIDSYNKDNIEWLNDSHIQNKNVTNDLVEVE